MKIILQAKIGQSMPINSKHILFRESNKLVFILDTDLVVFADFSSIKDSKEQFYSIMKRKLRTPKLICNNFGFLLQR